MAGWEGVSAYPLDISVAKYGVKYSTVLSLTHFVGIITLILTKIVCNLYRFGRGVNMSGDFMQSAGKQRMPCRPILLDRLWKETKNHLSGLEHG